MAVTPRAWTTRSGILSLFMIWSCSSSSESCSNAGPRGPMVRTLTMLSMGAPATVVWQSRLLRFASGATNKQEEKEEEEEEEQKKNQKEKKSKNKKT